MPKRRMIAYRDSTRLAVSVARRDTHPRAGKTPSLVSEDMGRGEHMRCSTRSMNRLDSVFC